MRTSNRLELLRLQQGRSRANNSFKTLPRQTKLEALLGKISKLVNRIEIGSIRSRTSASSKTCLMLLLHTIILATIITSIRNRLMEKSTVRRKLSLSKRLDFPINTRIQGKKSKKSMSMCWTGFRYPQTKNNVIILDRRRLIIHWTIWMILKSLKISSRIMLRILQTQLIRGRKSAMLEIILTWV